MWEGAWVRHGEGKCSPSVDLLSPWTVRLTYSAREHKRPPKPWSIIGRKRPGSIIRPADGLLKEGGQIPKQFFEGFAGRREVYELSVCADVAILPSQLFCSIQGPDTAARLLHFFSPFLSFSHAHDP